MPLTLCPRPVALLLALLTLAACDSAGEDEAAFTATLSGAVDARLEGEASFGTDAEAGALRFLILLQADEDRSGGVEGSVGFYVDDETRPAEGTYAVGEADGTAALIVLVDAQGSLSLTGVGGTLTLAESTPDRLSGSFSFEAETTFGGGETTVSGSFVAEPE